MTGKGRRQELKGGAEWDVVYARHMYKYLAKSKVAKWIKRRMNKRERQLSKQEINGEIE